MKINDKLKAIAKFNKAELAIVKRIKDKLKKRLVKQMITVDGTVWRLGIVRNTIAELKQVKWEELFETEMPSEGDYELRFVRADEKRYADIQLYGDEIEMPPLKFNKDIKFICFV